jgi:flagellar hook-length control protein FliK
MTMMLTTVNPSTPAQPTQQAKAPAGAQDTQAAAASTAAPAASAPTQSFARWLGQQPAGAAQALAAQPAVPGTDDGATPATAGAPAAGTPAPGAPDQTDSKSADDAKAATAPDSTLLAAMAMPLMPLTPQQVTQAVQAAQGGARAGSDERSDAPAADASAQPLAVAGQDGRRAALPQPGFIQTAQAQPATQPDATAANVRLAVQGNAAGGGNAGTDAQDASPDHAPVQAGTNAAAMSLPGVVGVQPAQSAQPAADTVKLAGPPTAWRQSLQETLGDRLNVHVANNVQQATISIEPPQLGRIDIAIRHSAGTLEVNISATNGDVLRQLQTVSDNLRNDLAQRQYTEVAVTVTPLPKNHAAPFGDPQQQGRGRQQGRDQDNEPGRGLAEAGNPASVFNLGRDS